MGSYPQLYNYSGLDLLLMKIEKSKLKWKLLWNENNENYYVEQVRTENMKRAFSISCALIWNSIPLSIKTLKKNQFKSELKRKLFEILEKEDDYIRVFDITGKFSKA